MLEALNNLRKYGIPIHSYIAAVQSLSDLELMPEQYRERFKELCGINSAANDNQIRIHYHYLVQETVRRSLNTDILDMDSIYEIATKRAIDYCNNNPWTFVEKEYSTSPKLDSEGNVKPKKGAKKELAKKVWADNKHIERTRKEWIALLVEEVGLTPAGASTYYSNLKNGKL